VSSLGVLSIHLDGRLDGAPCGVGCPFCYLGARVPLGPLVPLRRAVGTRHPSEELIRAAAELDYAELAIALSEPIEAATRDILDRLLAGARGRTSAITTTPQVVLGEPALLRGATRLNLSVDPWKLPGGDAALHDEVARAAAAARAHVGEVVAIATLSTPGFAEALIGGLLERLLATPGIDAVALSALKPPPPFCDRAFWLDALARLRPLLARELDRRLHLDCYVAARLLGIGGCPARPDLSPSGGRIAFRSCVYAARPDVEIDTLEQLRPTLDAFSPPASCPFDTRL